MATAAAIDEWFTLDEDDPHLIGSRCRSCGTTFFPRRERACANPSCAGGELEATELSSTGTIWSYTNAAYQPPDPYIVTADPYEPFAIAAVRLAAEEMVVLGQVATGVGVDDLHTGMEMKLVLETLYTDNETDYLVWKWRPTADDGDADQ